MNKIVELIKSERFAGYREKVYAFFDSKKATFAAILAILAAIGFNVWERTDLGDRDDTGIQISEEDESPSHGGDDELTGSGQDGREEPTETTDLGIEDGLPGDNGSTNEAEFLDTEILEALPAEAVEGEPALAG